MTPEPHLWPGSGPRQRRDNIHKALCSKLSLTLHSWWQIICNNVPSQWQITVIVAESSYQVDKWMRFTFHYLEANHVWRLFKFCITLIISKSRDGWHSDNIASVMRVSECGLMQGSCRERDWVTRADRPGQPSYLAELTSGGQRTSSRLSRKYQACIIQMWGMITGISAPVIDMHYTRRVVLFTDRANPNPVVLRIDLLYNQFFNHSELMAQALSLINNARVTTVLLAFIILWRYIVLTGSL